MSTRTSTSTTERTEGRDRNPSEHHTSETSFIDGTPSGKIYTEKMRLEEMKDEAVRRIKNVFPNAITSEFFVKIDEYEQVKIRLKTLRGVWYPILNEDGDVLINDGKGNFPK